MADTVCGLLGLLRSISALHGMPAWTDEKAVRLFVNRANCDKTEEKSIFIPHERLFSLVF